MLGNQADLSIVSIRVVGAARDLVNSTDVIDDDAESMFVRVSGDDWRELLHCLEIWEILVHDLGDDDAEPTEI
jgi:replication-associated recombination protein RarA